MKLLIVGDLPLSNYYSQIVPLTKCFIQQGYSVDTIALSPVTLKMIKDMPFFNEIICIKCFKGNPVILKQISHQEGKKANTGFYFMDDYDFNFANSSSVKLDQNLFNKFKVYDKIVIVYDENLELVKSFYLELINNFGAIGRISNVWKKEAEFVELSKFIPKETVEAFGFEYKDNLLSVDSKIHKVKNNYEGKNSVFLMWISGCESYMPVFQDRYYLKQNKLAEKLIKFKLIIADGQADPRLFVKSLDCDYTITTDSVAIWANYAYGYPKEKVYLLSVYDEIKHKRLGHVSILPKEYKSLLDVSSEVVVNYFLNVLRKREKKFLL